MRCRHVRCVGYLSGLSAEHKMLRDTCKQFADTHLVPHAAATDAKHEFPKAAVRCLLFACRRLFPHSREHERC
jgi:hypothetical protein